ncbi:MAG: TonB-dependent receptor [Bacteroides sp.]|nr:TonB-dependent receptor [Bacteroides sp.]
MPCITIFNRDLGIGVTIDMDGNYEIELPAGRHDLFVQGVGLTDTKRQILLHTGGALDIELEEQVYELDELTVSSERIANVRATTMGVQRLKLAAVKNVPTAFGEIGILRIVMSLPGVKSVGEVSSGFNVRGGSTDQNLILFNEGTIYNPTHLFGFFSAFNPDVVSEMELYKSSIPSKYGGRISSVLDINTREGNKEKLTGSASIGLLTSRLSFEGPMGKRTNFLLGGRTTYSDWILKRLPEKSGYKNGKAGFYDLNAAVNHRFGERDLLTVNGYFSHDRFSFNEYDKYAYQNTNASAKWRHIFGPETVGNFSAGYDHYGYTTTESEQEEIAYDLSFRINQYFAKADFTWKPHTDHEISFGYNGTFYDLMPGKYLPHRENSLIVPDIMQKERALESAFYVGDNWDITDKFSINAGIRYSLFNVLGPRTYNLYVSDELPSLETVTEEVSGSEVLKIWHGAEYRLSTRYEILDNLSVKAGFNTMRQYIHKLSNTTIMSPTDTWKLSDVNIRPQTGNQIAAGIYSNLMNNNLELSLEGYYKTMNNYLDYRSGAELAMNHHIETDVLETKGRAYGVEFMIKKPGGKLNSWVSYTYSHTQLRQKDLRIAEPMNGGDWYVADYDKPHELKFVGNYKFTRRYSASLNCDYSTGRPVTLPVSKYWYNGS